MTISYVNEQLGEFWDPTQDIILDQLRVYELEKLARTCRFFRPIINEELSRRKPMLHKLVRQVACGEEVAAKAALEIDPTLLLWKAGIAMDYSGRQIQNLTPFQAALCAGDTDMLKMMLPYFDLFPNGQTAMRAQFAEIFPDAEGGLEGHLQRQKENVFDFSDLTAAIDAAKNNPTELQDALNKIGARFTEKNEAKGKPYDQLTLTEKLNRFREKFTAKSYAEIVFNREHLIKAFAIYNEKFYDWDWDQRDLFWRQVIGFAQRFLPACDAQAFAQGLYDLVENRNALRRSFDFKHGVSFYPFDLNSGAYLGFDCGAVPLKRVGRRAGLGGCMHYKSLYRAKTLSLENLCRSDLHLRLGA